MKKASVLIIAVVVLLFLPAAFADYFDASATSVVTAGGSVNVTGILRLTNGTGIPRYNVTATLSGSSSTTVTNSNPEGAFSLLVNAPGTPADYNISLTTSGNATENRSVNDSIPIHVTNFTSANITFDGVQPPFTNGSSFVINVTTVGNGVTLPQINVFQSFGIVTSWNITNLTQVNNTVNATLRYNITIPSDADGNYIIIFERGLARKLFSVRSTLTVVADILDSQDAITTTVAQGSTATIRGRVFDSSGPITNANVTAFITPPNGSVVNTSLTHNSSLNGSYVGAFGQTSVAGSYTVSISAASSRTVSTSTSFTVGVVDAELSIVKDTFFEFGGDSAFAAGGQVAFNLLVFRLSDDSIFTGATAGGANRTNCTSVTPIEFRNLRTNTIVAFNGSNITTTTGNFFGQAVCKISFTAPAETGIYSLKINSTTNVSGTITNATATGYFGVQKYVLKVSPVSTLGGGSEFLFSLKPGDNASFEISARNLSSNGAAVPGLNITGITFKRLISLNFLRREADITGLSSNVTNGTASTNPKIQIVLPENRTGPYQIEVEAVVGGDVVTGRAFYFAKYIEGFAFPSGGGTGGGGEGGFGGEAFRCAGNKTFTARVTDVKTRQAARNVVFNSIDAVREERSGQDVSSFVKLLSSTPSDSNGQANLTINFSSGTAYSGFYFFLLNITTDDGKPDILPGGFSCRNLNFFPQISSNGSSTGNFNVAPTALLNITVSNIQNLNNNGTTVRNGTVAVSRLQNFDPAKGGGSIFIPSSTLTYNLSNGSVNFLLGAGNFSGLTAWPSGFNDLQITVTDNTTNTSDTQGGFFRVVAFDVFTSFTFDTFTPSQVVYREVSVRTNLTHNATNASYTNSTDGGFTAKMGRPWEGSLVDLTVNGTLISDNWSSPADFGSERWNVSFTIPASIRKGFNMIIITAKSNITNETSTAEIPGQVVKYSVTVPDEEFLQMQNFGVEANASSAGNVTAFNNIYRINLTALSTTFGVSSKSGRVCAAINFTASRFGPFGEQRLNYSLTDASAGNFTSVVVIDNGTANVYDVFVLNTSAGIKVLNITNRSFAPLFSGLYLRKINDCGFISIVNSTVSSTGFGSGFAGQQQKRTDFYVPFIVKQGGTAVSGGTVNITQLIKQEESGSSGGRGGFGFSGFVDRFNTTNATTDSNGVAFVRLNVNDSGPMNLIWRLDTQTGDTDTAEFFNGVPLEVKTFKTEGALSNTQPKVLTLVKNSSASYNATVSGSPIFVLKWGEALLGDIIDSSSTQNYTFALRNVTNRTGTVTPINYGDNNFTELIIDNDDDLTTAREIADTDGLRAADTVANWTEQFNIFQGGFAMYTVDSNVTVDENRTNITFTRVNTFFNTFLNNNGSSRFVHRNFTARVCAKTYDRPERPIIGGRVVLTTENFSTSGPPTTSNLTIYDPYSSSPVSSILTGPSGCATFNVTRPGGWIAGFPNNIQGTVTSGSDAENVFVGSIFVQCPTSGSCY